MASSRSRDDNHPVNVTELVFSVFHKLLPQKRRLVPRAHGQKPYHHSKRFYKILLCLGEKKIKHTRKITPPKAPTKTIRI